MITDKDRESLIADFNLSGFSTEEQEIALRFIFKWINFEPEDSEFASAYNCAYECFEQEVEKLGADMCALENAMFWTL